MAKLFKTSMEHSSVIPNYYKVNSGESFENL